MKTLSRSKDVQYPNINGEKLQRAEVSQKKTKENLTQDSKRGPGLSFRIKAEATIYSLTKSGIFVVSTIIASGLFGNFSGWSNLEIFGFALLVYLISFFRLPVNDLMPTRKIRINFNEFIKTELRFILFIAAIIFFAGININPESIALIMIINLIGQSILFTMWQYYNGRLITGQKLDCSQYANKQVVIVGSSNNAQEAADLFLRYPDLNINITGFVDYQRTGLWRYRDLPLLGHPDILEELILNNQIDYLVIAVEPEDFTASRAAFDSAERMGIDIVVMPSIYKHENSHCHATQINGQSVLVYHAIRHTPLENLMKSAFDKICALFGLLISGPILLLTAILIKLDSRGPIFFKQERVGKNGKPFKMLKLRTMVNDAARMKSELEHLNEMSGPVFKIKNDPRITRVGKVLRKFSIDEFPQFINILKGDMSMVGPRPSLAKEVAEFDPWHRRKLSVKPGATCLWQINGRNKIDFDDWIRLDLKYIDNWSLMADANIVARTIPAVLKGDGAS